MLTSLSPAVRHDRMRGGRNKFGPMYKRDRARKLQVHPMLQVQLWVLIGDLCSKCHQVWSFVINLPFPNDWHNFKLPPICPTDQVSRLFCTISNSFFFLEGTVTPCRYYTFLKTNHISAAMNITHNFLNVFVTCSRNRYHASCKPQPFIKEHLRGNYLF